MDVGKSWESSTVVIGAVTTYISEVFAREILQFEVGLMVINKYDGDVIYRVRKLVLLAKPAYIFWS